MPSPGELSPDLVQGGAIAIELAFVAADERSRALTERGRRAWPRIALPGAPGRRCRASGSARGASGAEPLSFSRSRLRGCPAKESKSCVSGVHGIESWFGQGRVGVDVTQGTFDLDPTPQSRCVSVAEMRAPPRFARLRSLSANDACLLGSYVSQLGYFSRNWSASSSGSSDLAAGPESSVLICDSVVVAPGCAVT